MMMQYVISLHRVQLQLLFTRGVESCPCVPVRLRGDNGERTTNDLWCSSPPIVSYSDWYNIFLILLLIFLVVLLCYWSPAQSHTTKQPQTCARDAPLTIVCSPLLSSSCIRVAVSLGEQPMGEEDDGDQGQYYLLLKLRERLQNRSREIIVESHLIIRHIKNMSIR